MSHRIFKRDGAWWIDYNDAQGKRRRKRTSASKRVAQEILNDTLTKVAKREHLGVLDESKISFSDFVDVWKARVLPRLSPWTRKRWENVADAILKPAFTGSLRGITAAAIESFVAAELATKKPSTVKTEHTILRHVLNRAAEWEYVAKRETKAPRALARVNDERTRFLSEEEIAGILKACEPGSRVSALGRVYLRPFVIVALSTGMRRSEILSLRWQDVDLENGLARLTKTKNGEPRTVFLNESAIAALRSIPAGIGPIFPFTPQAVTDAFERACTRAKIEDFRLHDLRHTFASRLAMAGVAQAGLQALLGHRDGRMTNRYTHVGDGYLREAVERGNLGAGKKSGKSRRRGTNMAPAGKR